jgi:hypothetical protein
MNALYRYFFPAPAPAPEPAPEPAPVWICFTRKQTIHTLSLSEVATMTSSEILAWRPWIVAHMCETYVAEESENSDLILDAMDARLRDLEPEDPTG